uniref:NADH-ubiquinone oxidoreductase chain 2 n=1 Tax=Stylochyrus rarior TaxID=679428 RepID=D0UY30_STYRA|nr:NADH dehydrogenase subunit 2 [Stylochyrus rarior]ACY35974.1 NADH dehydrogenase subunit 2 [Stylochyrus rarior]
MNTMSLLFYSMLIFSTLLAFSSNNWFQLWAALEVNMMVFIPIMFNKNNLSIMSMIKYFIFQSSASIIFLLSNLSSFSNLSNVWINLFIMMSMSIKLGMAPIYFWLPQMIEGLNWLNMTILLTWQKLIPLFIISCMTFNTKLNSVIIIISAMLGSLMMIKQTSLRKLLAYSSITHMAWILFLITNQSMYWTFYFICYSILSVLIYFFMKTHNLSSLFEGLYTLNFNNKILLMTIFMSISGLPPFLGFYPKWMALNMAYNSALFVIVFLILSSLINIFIYLRISYPLIMSKTMMNKSSKIKNYNLFMMNLMSLIIFIPLMKL